MKPLNNLQSCVNSKKTTTFDNFHYYYGYIYFFLYSYVQHPTLYVNDITDIYSYYTVYHSILLK